VRRGYGTIIALALVLAACGSGPSPDAVARNEPPPTTTTTTLPPAGVVVVTIKNGKFSPALLKIKLDESWIVRWVNEDPPREYVLAANDLFESPTLAPGDSFEFDFSTIDPGIYRYYTFIGNQRVPGSVDTRPER
jgi:plastocyanin